MASWDHSYTYMLVGFGRDLDNRPTEFLEPFPVSRICGLCGAVPNEVALLPCWDVVCRACYNCCATDSSCALHSCARFRTEDVYWQPLPLSDVAERKVRCWNAKNGCGRVLVVRDVACHFHGECQFHNVACRRCRKNVLRTDIVQHLRHDCASCILEGQRLTPDGRADDDGVDGFALGFVSNIDVVKNNSSITDSQATEDLGRTHDEDLLPCQEMSRAKEEVTYDRRQGETLVTECLERMSLDGLAVVENQGTKDSTHDEDFSPREEMPRGKKQVTLDCREDETVVVELLNTPCLDGLAAVENQRTKACSGANDAPSFSSGDEPRNVANVVTTRLHLMSAHNIEILEKLQDQVFGGLAKCIEVCRTLEFESCVHGNQEWLVTGWAEIRNKTSMEGGTWYYSQPRYFHGYHMSSAIFVRGSGGGELKVHIGLVLRKGVVDERLEWPFRRRVRLTFMHPGMCTKPRFLTLTPNSATAGGKPEAGTIIRFYSTGRYCMARDLEKEGYVRNDQLRVKFEVAL